MHTTATPLSIAMRTFSAVLLLASAFALRPSAAGAQMPVGPFQEMSTSASSIRDSIVSIARAQIGKRYVLGGQTPDRGFDCSGLVKYVMAMFRLDLPRTARQQARAGLPLERDTSRLRPGDLLTFGNAKGRVEHVGIYIGNGRYIHASSVAGRVIESPINRPPSRLIKAWRGARRMLALDDDSTAAPAPVSGNAEGAAPSKTSG